MPVMRLAFLMLMSSAALAAQHDSVHHTPATPRRDSVAAMVIALATRVSPAVFGMVRSEAQLTQPMLMFRGARRAGAFRYAAMLNAERWSMPDGEPVAGIWGEGFIDRRHPHTVVHEVMITGVRQVAGASLSLSAGKGIVPFGTDDPMARPLAKYPANHHLSQVLERIQLVIAIRPGTHAAVELALFNGDDPAGPTASPQWRRFGDSRAVRLSVWPRTSIEIQASGASVRSPEFASGEGLDQHKFSGSARLTPRRGAMRYALLEWARTEERYRRREIVGYGTVLAEGVVGRGAISVGGRLEQTSRPEEERLLDPFRTARPANDLTIKGITRWRLATLQASVAMPHAGSLHGLLFGEVTRAVSTPLLSPVLLDPRDVIGSASAWHVSLGARVGAGSMASRVGRYGASAGGAATDVPLAMGPHH